MDQRTEAFYAAISANDAAAVKTALAAAPTLVTARERHLGSTPLHLAAFRGHLEVVRTLLEFGADVRALERESGSAPLHWAAEAGHEEIVGLLLGRGAELEVRDAWYGLTPLGWATSVFWTSRARKDRAAVIGQLRDAGARSDAFTELGANDLEGLRRVLAADPAELTRRLGFAGDEMQPLHWAGAYGKEEAIGLLLSLGADVRARTTLGLTPLGAALQRAQAGSAAAFLAHGYAGDETTAVVGGFTAVVEAAAAAGQLPPDLASRLLFVAAAEGHAELVRLLVKLGADPRFTVRRVLGEFPMPTTALHLAAQSGREAAARALLDAGARHDAGAAEGTPTPLHIAAGEGHEGVALLLLQRGADPLVRERAYGSTPSDWAGAAGHRELVLLLSAQSVTPRG